MTKLNSTIDIHSGSLIHQEKAPQGIRWVIRKCGKLICIKQFSYFRYFQVIIKIYIRRIIFIVGFIRQLWVILFLHQNLNINCLMN